MIRSDDFVVVPDLVADFGDLVPIDYAFQIVAILPGNVMATLGDSSQQPFNGQPWHLSAIVESGEDYRPAQQRTPKLSTHRSGAI